MKFYLLNIFSKNEKSLTNFTNFVLKTLKHCNLTKINKKKNKKKILTILKSPHINKKAQEHFETRIFSKKIVINTISIFDQHIFFKKIIKKSFHDIKLYINYVIDHNLLQKTQFKIFNFKNFKLKFNNKKKINSKLNTKKLKFFFEITNILGEIKTNVIV